MARNAYGGNCYKCQVWVMPRTGHFEFHRGKWRVQHALHPGDGRVTCEMVRKQIAENRRAGEQGDPGWSAA